MIFGQHELKAQTQHNIAPLKGRLTQYMLHQPFINPAAMGSYETFTAAAFYRNQWVGMNGTPNVQGLDATIPIGEVNFLGASILRDDIGGGYEKRYDFNINYAFKLRLTDNDYLSLGLSAGGDYIVNDYSELYGIANDPSLPTGTESFFAPNMRLGLYYFRNRVYVGAALSNLFSTTEDKTESSGYRTNYLDWNEVDYMGHAGVRIPVGDYWDLDLSTLGRYRATAKFQADFNAQFIYDKIIGIGATYRTSNEVAFMANFRFLDHFRLGYAYGTFVNELSNSNSGTHEIMLIYQLGSPKGSAIVIPRF